MSKADLAERERAIIKYLQGVQDEGATVKDIHESVATKLDDPISRPAYYKILDRMEAAGKIEVLREEPDRGRIYGLSSTLHAGNPITLDDIYEMLPFVRTTEALARAIDAQDYYEEHRLTVLRQAGQALLKEDPVNLLYSMIQDMARIVTKDLAILRHKNDAGQPEIADSYAEKRLDQDYRDLEQVAYRALSLPHDAIDLPGLHQLRDMGKNIDVHNDQLREALRCRVFGETVIREIDVSPMRMAVGRQQLVVSGSDGSMHAGTLALQSANAFQEDLADIITFNNSVVYVRLSRQQAAQEKQPEMVHSAPFTRQTLDDPSYKGMVLAPFMFPDLSESEYEHMARCATDVVQFRVDEQVFTGKAYNLRPPHSQIPRPQVHIRDGTITPQEREFMHYNRPDPYGEMVREGIALERSILERIMAGRKRAPIFGGVVKSTQMRVFSRLLNWYISQGSKATLGAAIEPNWDIARTAAISDNGAMTALLSALPPPKSGKLYVTCALLREFPSLTEYYGHDLKGETWTQFFEKKKRQELQDNSRYGGRLGYHAMHELADDDYIFMCENADYVYFYIGYTGGDPPPMIPRFEFLTSLRVETQGDDADPVAAGLRVEDVVRRIVDGVDAAGIAADRDHNYLTGKMLIKLLPFPVQQAHEYAKTLGHKLEAELKSIVISRLIQMKSVRLEEGRFDVRPVTVQKYMKRIARALGGEAGNQPDETR